MLQPHCTRAKFGKEARVQHLKSFSSILHKDGTFKAWRADFSSTLRQERLPAWLININNERVPAHSAYNVKDAAQKEREKRRKEENK